MWDVGLGCLPLKSDCLVLAYGLGAILNLLYLAKFFSSIRLYDMMPKYSSKHGARECWINTLPASVTTTEGDWGLLLILTLYDQSVNIPVYPEGLG